MEEDEDWLSKPASTTDEQMVREYEYVEEDRYSYVVKTMSEASDVLVVIMYKAKSEDEWSPIVV